jgi:predicted nicotinamide N-methyase
MSTSECQELVVFSYARVEDSLKLQTRSFNFFGKEIVMEQRWSADGKGGSGIGFGCSVYDCSFVLGKFIEQHPDIIRGDVIELGCGPGLCSVVSALSGVPSKVVATDGDDISVDLTRDNLIANLNGASEAASVTTQKLLWGNEEDLQGHKQQYDVVLAADVVALPYETAYIALLDTLQAVVKPTGCVWLCYQQRHASEQNGFFSHFRSRFYVSEIEREKLHVDFRKALAFTPIQLFRAVPRINPPN